MYVENNINTSMWYELMDGKRSFIFLYIICMCVLP